jgi:hypothetical protein
MTEKIPLGLPVEVAPPAVASAVHRDAAGVVLAHLPLPRRSQASPASPAAARTRPPQENDPGRVAALGLVASVPEKKLQVRDLENRYAALN